MDYSSILFGNSKQMFMLFLWRLCCFCHAESLILSKIVTYLRWYQKPPPITDHKYKLSYSFCSCSAASLFYVILVLSISPLKFSVYNNNTVILRYPFSIWLLFKTSLLSSSILILFCSRTAARWCCWVSEQVQHLPLFFQPTTDYRNTTCGGSVD